MQTTHRNTTKAATAKRTMLAAREIWNGSCERIAVGGMHGGDCSTFIQGLWRYVYKSQLEESVADIQSGEELRAFGASANFMPFFAGLAFGEIGAKFAVGGKGIVANISADLVFQFLFFFDGGVVGLGVGDGLVDGVGDGFGDKILHFAPSASDDAVDSEIQVGFFRLEHFAEEGLEFLQWGFGSGHAGIITDFGGGGRGKF